MKSSKRNIRIFTVTFIVVLILLLTVVYAINSLKITTSKKYDYSLLKENSNLDYVYQREKIKNKIFTNVDDNIPSFNIKNAISINNKIVNDYNDITKLFDYTYTYKYYVSNRFVSIIVFVSYIGKSNLYQSYKYYTYIYDLETDKSISPTNLIKLYGLNNKQISSFLKNKYINYYLDMLKKGYFTKKDCSYGDFLANKNINFKNYLAAVSYSVEDNALILYKPFSITSNNGDNKYFTTDNFRFVLLKSK